MREALDFRILNNNYLHDRRYLPVYGKSPTAFINNIPGSYTKTVMDWLVEELRDDSLRMSTEELSTGCASGARPTYGPPSGYSITKTIDNLILVLINVLSVFRA